MPESSPVIFAMCGIGLVCLGVLGIGAFMLLRATNKTFLAPLLGMLTGQVTQEPNDDDPLPSRSNYRVPSTQNIQSQAQSLDFDSAVQRYRQQTPPPNVPQTPTQPAPSTFAAQSAPQPPPPVTPLRPPTAAPPQNPWGNTQPAPPPNPYANTQPAPPPSLTQPPPGFTQPAQPINPIGDKRLSPANTPDPNMPPPENPSPPSLGDVPQPPLRGKRFPRRGDTGYDFDDDLVG